MTQEPKKCVLYVYKHTLVYNNLGRHDNFFIFIIKIGLRIQPMVFFYHFFNQNNIHMPRLVLYHN